MLNPTVLSLLIGVFCLTTLHGCKADSLPPQFEESTAFFAANKREIIGLTDSIRREGIVSAIAVVDSDLVVKKRRDEVGRLWSDENSQNIRDEMVRFGFTEYEFVESGGESLILGATVSHAGYSWRARYIRPTDTLWQPKNTCADVSDFSTVESCASSLSDGWYVFLTWSSR